MNVTTLVARLLSDDHVAGTPEAALRHVVAWLFIAVVASCLTQPACTASAFDAPVPWPAELGLDGNPATMRGG